MALDNAQFIAELSITDPPGSDPLSQGDDQIRATKRSVQQSLPLLDKAVNITADQMNLMAIKNEANVFTAAQTIQDADLILNQVVDGFTRIEWQLAGLPAWTLSMRDAAALNGLQLRRFDALGATVDVPFDVSLVTGVVNFEHVPTVDGAPLWVAGEIRMFAITATPGANWFLADGLNGTVDLTDRAVLGSGLSPAGTSLVATFAGTAAAGVTGATAITEAQMPAHVHQHGMTQTDQLSADTTNIEDQSAGTVADDPSRPFHVITEPTGGGGSHTHTSPAQAVTETGTGRDVVRPFSRVVEMYQYVP